MRNFLSILAVAAAATQLVAAQALPQGQQGQGQVQHGWDCALNTLLSNTHAAGCKSGDLGCLCADHVRRAVLRDVEKNCNERDQKIVPFSRAHAIAKHACDLRDDLDDVDDHDDHDDHDYQHDHNK
ncbi:hypothetical protein T310_7148, partial [Rasamsonia emersonii CBS 393.64]